MNGERATRTLFALGPPESLLDSPALKVVLTFVNSPVCISADFLAELEAATVAVNCQDLRIEHPHQTRLFA
jgi:hypothetical protein